MESDIACFPDDLVVLQLLQDQGEEERENCQEVDDVHRVLDEFHLGRADGEPGEELQGEEDDDGLVYHIDDLHNEGKLLEFIRGGDDECQCRNNHGRE